MLGGGVGAGASALPFGDVATNAWYYDAVSFAYKDGIMSGVSDTAFEPQMRMSRAMLITVLARRNGVDTTGGVS